MKTIKMIMKFLNSLPIFSEDSEFLMGSKKRYSMNREGENDGK